MPAAAQRFRALQSQSFWLALFFWLTCQHLPSVVGTVLAVLFVFLVWQLTPRTRWSAIGLSFVILLGLGIATQLFLLALPKTTALSWLSPSLVRVPAQVAYVAPLGGLGSWVAFVLTALLRYYELNESSKGGLRLRFVAASTIIWASFALVAEKLASAPVSGIAMDLAPLVSLPIFVAFPASFLFWRFKGRSWVARWAVALVAQRAVALAYLVLVWVMMLTRAMLITVPIYVVAISVTGKAWNRETWAVGVLWAAAVAYLRTTTEDTASSGKPNFRFSTLVPVLVCAVPALAVAFAFDIHHRITDARIEAEKVARGNLQQQKLAAMLKWRLVLPREVPSSLAILQPPVVGLDGSAYVVARKESRLHAVDSSGHVKWSFAGVIAANPAVARDGTVYVVGTAHTLYALDAGSGQVRWSTQFSDGLDLICTGPALAADGTIYTLTQRNPFSLQLNALTPEGKVRWQITEPSEKMCSIHDVVEMAPQVLPAPVVGSDGTIYFTHEGLLYAVDSRGVAKWSAPSERPVAKLMLGKHGEVYAYAEQLTAFDANGQQQWTSPRRTALWLHPDIGTDGTIYLVDSSGYGRKLVAINPDGSEKWTFEGDPAIQAVLAGSDDTLYICASNGALYALDAQQHRLDWGDAATVSGAPMMAPDGAIYAATYDGEFFALYPPRQGNPQGSPTIR